MSVGKSGLLIKVHRSTWEDETTGESIWFESIIGDEGLEGGYEDASLVGQHRVNLSRKGENPTCWFPVTNLQGHKSHTPLMHSKEEAEEYLARVKADFDAACAAIEQECTG